MTRDPLAQTGSIEIVLDSNPQEATLRLSRTDLLPVLTIMAGGVIGASLSLSSPLLLRSGDVPVPEPVVASYESYRSVEVLQSEEQKALARAVALSRELLESEAAKSAPDPLRRRFLQEYRRLALDRMEQVITDVEKLQEEGWDVTFRPPVFRLPEIRQR